MGLHRLRPGKAALFVLSATYCNKGNYFLSIAILNYSPNSAAVPPVNTPARLAGRRHSHRCHQHLYPHCPAARPACRLFPGRGAEGERPLPSRHLHCAVRSICTGGACAVFFTAKAAWKTGGYACACVYRALRAGIQPRPHAEKTRAPAEARAFFASFVRRHCRPASAEGRAGAYFSQICSSAFSRISFTWASFRA